MDDFCFMRFNRFNIRCLYFFGEGVMVENDFYN